MVPSWHRLPPSCWTRVAIIHLVLPVAIIADDVTHTCIPDFGKIFLMWGMSYICKLMVIVRVRNGKVIEWWISKAIFPSWSLGYE